MTDPESNRREHSGLLLIGHGTRDAAGSDEFRDVTRAVEALRPGLVVELGFLELAEPTISEGVARAFDRGATHIVAAPLLLFSAGHAKRDIPAQLQAAAQRHAGLKIEQSGHLGCRPAIVELSARRFEEAVPTLDAVAAAETLLLLVGRGSRDPEANSEMARFARLRWERTPVGWLETCFLAMTEPSLDRALEVVGAMPFRRVVVQPHLLFRGELLDRIATVVSSRANAWPDKEWIVTGHLGDPNSLARAVLEQFSECVAEP